MGVPQGRAPCPRRRSPGLNLRRFFSSSARADGGDAVTGELLSDVGPNRLCGCDIGLAAGVPLFELGEPATIQRLCQIWVAAKRFVVVGQRIIQPV